MSQLAAVPIDALSAGQAQRALVLFYDLLPAEFWPDATRPSVADLEVLCEDVREAAARTGAAKAVDALLTGEGAELRGEAARAVLHSFRSSDELRPLVDQAAERATRPDMAPIPVVIGAFILALAVLPEVEYEREGEATKLRIRWNPAQRAGDMVAKLTDLMKAIPARVLEKLR